VPVAVGETCQRPATMTGAGGGAGGGDDGGASASLPGEWRQVENIITIFRDNGGALAMAADASQPPLRLFWLGDGRWQARRYGSNEGVYDLTLGGRDALEIRKGERVCRIFRVARSKTIIGDWAHHAGKTLSVVDVGGGEGPLEIRMDGRPALSLARRRVMGWEARREREGVADPVYLVDHVEGSQRITIRRPDDGAGEVAPPLEFVRAGSCTPLLTAAQAPSPWPPLHDSDVRLNSEPRLGSPRPWWSGGGSGRGEDRRCQDLSPRAHAADLEDFCAVNQLNDRVCSALHELGIREQRHVMGVDGGRNSFQLTGTVRDPGAVVMSRIKRLEMEPLHSLSRSRSHSPWRREQRSHSGGGRRRRPPCPPPPPGP